LGLSGSRSKGLEYIQKAASVRNLAQGDASFMMVYIYKNKEKNYGTALRYNLQLRQKYPNNPIFLFDEVEIYWHQKNPQASRASLNQFLTYCSAHPCAQQKLFLSNYYLAKIHMDEKDHSKAKGYLNKATELDTGKNKEITASLRQWQEDLAGK
jgi:tetratricopeptide (TPR) repeat protein